jgi:hypothetical protein
LDDNLANGLGSSESDCSSATLSSSSSPSQENSMDVDDSNADSYDASDCIKFVQNVERMDLDENSDPEQDDGGVETSFVSNGSTLIGQSPSRDSAPKICSKNKCVEGTLKNGALVVFDVNSTTGNKYACCRKCKAYVHEIGYPKVSIPLIYANHSQ